MKYTLILIVSILFSIGQVKAQNGSVSALLKEGVAMSKNGDHEGALAKYKEVLVLEPNSPDALYETAMTYMQLQEFESAIKYADKILETDNPLHIHAYVCKASALDYLNEKRKAIALYKEAISNEGDNYLLHYNLAYTYFSLLGNENAEKHAIMAINDKKNHASSHLLLASINIDQGQRVEAILPLYYYLLLEPTSVRSEDAYNLLLDWLNKKHSFDEIENEIWEDYRAVEKYLSLSKEQQLSKGEGFEIAEMAETTSSVAFLCKDLSESEGNIYADFYGNFMYALSKTQHLFTFSNYISQIYSTHCYRWSLENKEKLDAFHAWMEKESSLWMKK